MWLGAAFTADMYEILGGDAGVAGVARRNCADAGVVVEKTFSRATRFGSMMGSPPPCMPTNCGNIGMGDSEVNSVGGAGSGVALLASTTVVARAVVSLTVLDAASVEGDSGPAAER